MTTPTPKAMEASRALFRYHALRGAPRVEHVALAIDAAVEEAVKAEREACAKVCDGLSRESHACMTERDSDDAYVSSQCARAIRARGAS